MSGSGEVTLARKSHQVGKDASRSGQACGDRTDWNPRRGLKEKQQHWGLFPRERDREREYEGGWVLVWVKCQE